MADSSKKTVADRAYLARVNAHVAKQMKVEELDREELDFIANLKPLTQPTWNDRRFPNVNQSQNCW